MNRVATRSWLRFGGTATVLGWLALLGLVTAILAVFIIRTLLAYSGNPPRIFEIFDLITVAASAGALAMGYRSLTRSDWLVGLGAQRIWL